MFCRRVSEPAQSFGLLTGFAIFISRAGGRAEESDTVLAEEPPEP